MVLLRCFLFRPWFVRVQESSNVFESSLVVDKYRVPRRKVLSRKTKLRNIEVKLRSKSEILHIAMSLAPGWDKHHEVAIDTENQEVESNRSGRKNKCKACGEFGHYAKCCPLKEPEAFEMPYERQERHRANRRAHWSERSGLAGLYVL